MIQFVTDNKSEIPVEEQVMKAIDAGCRWILLDTTGKTAAEMAPIVEAIMHRCMETETFLLIDNDVDMAKELNVGGVNLHKGTPPSQARVKLGAAAVIGVETDNFADIVAMKPLDIDYFSFVYPDTDVAAISEMVEKAHKEEVEQPLVVMARKATKEDYDKLKATGINGITIGDLTLLKELMA